MQRGGYILVYHVHMLFGEPRWCVKKNANSSADFASNKFSVNTRSIYREWWILSKIYIIVQKSKLN
jgi:hypothetical protein